MCIPGPVYLCDLNINLKLEVGKKGCMSYSRVLVTAYGRQDVRKAAVAQQFAGEWRAGVHRSGRDVEFVWRE